jgi:translocation and assembly module TamB
MRISFKGLRRLGLGLLIALVLVGVVVWIWVIPAAIRAGIRAHYDGHFAFEGWWIGRSSAGVTGLTLHEGPSPDSPVWASAERVATDLSLGGLLRGRFTPRRIVFRHPFIQYRIDAQGNPLTNVPLRNHGGGAYPEIIVEDGQLAIRQVDRPELLITHLDGRMGTDASGPPFELKADDPRWGHPALVGHFNAGFDGFAFRLTADGLLAEPDKCARIPFVEEKVWTYVDPRGPFGVVLNMVNPPAGSGRVEVRTTVTFEQTRIALPTLGLVGDEATGRVTIRDKVVGLEDVRGRMAGGRVELGGTLDFAHEPIHYRLDLGLDGVDLSALSPSWELDRAGIRGRLTGSADLRMALLAQGLDLIDSSGSGRIDGANFRGIPLQRLDLTIRADGPRPTESSAGPPKGPFLPQWIAGEFRVRDVELERALAEVGSSSGRDERDIPVSGRLALEATARLPLGDLDDMTAYTVHGAADLAGAAIGDLDLGRLKSRFDLKKGVLELTDLRGRLIDRPDDRRRPRETEPPQANGPLHPGGFRGRVRAELAGDQKVHVDVDGEELPIGELIALASSRRDLPISGRLTFQVAADARGPTLSDPRAWAGTGRARAPEVSYRKTTLREVSTGVALDRGRLVLSGLKARLGDDPLEGRLGIDLAEPWSYEGEIHAGDLPLRDLLALLPHVPEGFPVSGTIAGLGTARGTVRPWRIESSGEAEITRAEAGRIAIGDVPIRWTTQDEEILLTAEEVQRYGGRIAAEARVPVRGDRPIEGTMRLKRVDAAELTADAPESWKMTGRADGQGKFTLRPGSGDKGPDLDGQAQLSSDELTVRGIPANAVGISLTMRNGVPRFDVQAESLGGSIRVSGDARLAKDPKDDRVQADVRAIAVKLYEIWDALDINSGISGLRGRANLVGKVRSRTNFKDVRANAEVNLDDLIWGYDYRLGRVRAGLSMTPEGWRIGPFGGELWGSPVKGEGIWMDRPEGGLARYGFDLRLDRVTLARGLAFLPEADRRFGGYGMLRVTGKSYDVFRGTAEFRVDRGLVNGLELTELRAPADWSLTTQGTRRGTLRINKAAGKLAGGRVGGDAWIALGDRRDFRAKLFVDDVDLRVMSRDEAGNRSVPGRLSGFINVSGTDPLELLSYRGEVDFDLVQASLVDIPLLDELDRSLGSAQGGVFNEGDLHGTIAEQRLHIDRLTLVGPLAQVHSTGWLDFDGRLNMEVVVNTNRALPAAGQVLQRAPDVAETVARRAAAIDQVSDFLASRLMMFRISGTIRDPVVSVDRSINPRTAIAFFFQAMRLSAQAR